MHVPEAVVCLLTLFPREDQPISSKRMRELHDMDFSQSKI